MKRLVLVLLLVASVILGVVGSVSAAHDEINPFSVRIMRSSR